VFEGFVNPALLAGLGLASVPILIHLLNRQRHRPLPWAAMRFVLAAYRRTRRRVQLENLLLLALRTAAIAFLALAVARPFASSTGALAPLTEKRRDVVLLLDGSASTGYREEVETVFERIVQRASALVGDLEGARGDRVNLILAGNHPRAFGWQDPDKARSLLATLTQPTDERLDLTEALGVVRELAQEDAAGGGASGLEVRLLGDLQRADFAALEGRLVEALAPEGADEAAEPRDRPLLREHLDALAELSVDVLVEDLGPSATRPANLTLAAVAPAEPIWGPGARVDIGVEIRNSGSNPRPAERVALVIDGNKLPVTRVDVPAEGSAEAIFTTTFDQPGAHALVAELEGDRLAIDDRRASVVVVPPPVRILAVNGAPSDDIEEDELGFFLLALEPLASDGLASENEPAPFQVHEVTADALLGAELDLRPYDVLLLADVAVIPEAAVRRLEERVAAGASLVLAMGERVADLGAQNGKLFRADGTGLLPAELVTRVSSARREEYWRAAHFDESHPVLAFFADELWKPLLAEAPVYTFVRARPLPDARVLASLDDESGSPLLVERGWDQGRVFLWTTSLSQRWTDIPRSPKTLVPLAHEWMRYAGTRRAAQRTVGVGEPVGLVVASFPRAPELVRPDQTRRPLTGDVLETADGRWRLPEIGPNETQRVGLYEVRQEGGPVEPFAVQLDPAEGWLERLLPSELPGLHPALRPTTPDDRREDGESGPARGEIWRTLALVALASLVLESLWAAWIGRRRRSLA